MYSFEGNKNLEYETSTKFIYFFNSQKENLPCNSAVLSYDVVGGVIRFKNHGLKIRSAIQ